MKRNEGKYRVVATVPPKAKTVKEYATENNFTQSYVYKLMERGKANFEMVIFKGTNFVIPN